MMIERTLHFESVTRCRFASSPFRSWQYTVHEEDKVRTGYELHRFNCKHERYSLTRLVAHGARNATNVDLYHDCSRTTDINEVVLNATKSKVV